jgi:hypothetical protein
MEKINLGLWESFTAQIRTHLETDNINNFHNWDILRNTMIAGVDLVEFEYLTKSKYWDIWAKKLDETVLKPNTYNNFPSSSTNNMHHAYSLEVMMEYLEFKLDEFDTVVEFGGGYGNTVRLFKRWEHKGEYYIYDINELLTIQKHYLTENGVNDINYLEGHDKVENVNGNSLFLGLWSISETPTSERNRMLDNLGFFKCKNIFIAMGDNFYDEDNIKWLYDDIVPTLNELGYSHNLKKIAHGSGMYYFMAKLKN